ncbi:hypothetical protein D3C75_600860 [compost metagenome]
MRSIDQVSNGKVMPTPPYWRMPSYRRITEAPSVKPRLDSALRPLPGWGMALIAPARVIASLRLESPRCSSCSREITVRLAGVCNTLSPSAEPVLAVEDSEPLRVSTTRTVSRVVGGTASSARAGTVCSRDTHSAGSAVLRRRAELGFVFICSRHARPPRNAGQLKEFGKRARRSARPDLAARDNQSKGVRAGLRRPSRPVAPALPMYR